MALYNQLMGVNPCARKLCELLLLDLTSQPAATDDESIKSWAKGCIDNKRWIVGRFRDIYMTEDAKKIVLFARNGAGSWGGTGYATEVLRRHPLYIRDYEDAIDRTYVMVEFSMPESASTAMISFLTENGAVYTETPLVRFQKLVKKLQNGVKPEDDPEVAHALDVGRRLLKPLVDKIEGGDSSGMVIDA